MLDQNTDRMWYVIGAVLIGAAIIFGMNTFMPETFASVGGMFEDLIGIVNYDPKREEIESLVAEGYIPVATADELDSIRDNTPRTYGKGTEWEGEYTGGLSRRYIQVANIDLSEYSEEGWNPIGSDYYSRFRGTYDGGNYVIRGLEVKGEGSNNQGLFGYASGATIRNVGLIDNKITGSDYVGGLVGSAQHSTIEKSYATGEVTGTDWYVGGLVGYADSHTKISNSYATGEVTGGSFVGGLVGYINNYTTISNSYVTGPVTGGGFVGGLVGSGGSTVTVTNSYWDTESTGRPTSAGGEGKSTEEMKNQATYEGWDFETVWKIDGNDYPKLR